MSDSAASKNGSVDSKTDDGKKDSKPEVIGKLADRKSTPGETETGDADGTAEGEHGRHEAVERDEVSDAERPGYSPSERNLQASLAGDHHHRGDPLSADRPDVPEDERREPPHRVEAPKYPGPLPGETTAEFEGRTERSAGDPIPDSAQSSALHAAMITGEAQAGHRYPHQRP